MTHLAGIRSHGLLGLRGHVQTLPHLVCGTALILSVTPVFAQQGATNGEWRYYAGDNGSTKYSPLDQIDAQNFARLEVKWR